MTKYNLPAVGRITKNKLIKANIFMVDGALMIKENLVWNIFSPGTIYIARKNHALTCITMSILYECMEISACILPANE